MKFALALFGLMISSFAFADDVILQEKVRFNYSSNQAYYHCDYFERQAKKMVQALGGERVDVRCSFGLPDHGFLSGSIHSQAKVSSDRRTTRTVELKINEACDFNEKLLKAIVKSSTRIASVKKRGSCFQNQGRIRYQLNVYQ